MKRLTLLLLALTAASFFGLLLDRRDDRLLREGAGESEGDRRAGR